MKKTFFAISLFLFPVLSFAQVTRNQTKDVGGLMELFGSLVVALIPIASMLAFLAFLYGLAIFIFKAGDPEEAQKGKGIMVWGILALFVLVSIYGIIGFIQRSTGTDQAGISNPIVIPSVVPSTVQ